jgi:hypothetical protein
MVIKTGLMRALPIDVSAVAAQTDEQALALSIATKALRYFEAVHSFTEGQVKDDDIRPEVLGQVDRRQAIACRSYVIAPGPDQHGKSGNGIRAVVNDEDLAFARLAATFHGGRL